MTIDRYDAGMEDFPFVASAPSYRLARGAMAHTLRVSDADTLGAAFDACMAAAADATNTEPQRLQCAYWAGSLRIKFFSGERRFREQDELTRKWCSA